MIKQGILHDYDLMANQEPSARKGNTCVTCGYSPVTYQWSDYSGEGMCTKCGTPYQLKWGSGEQTTENNYPYLNLKDEWVPIVREYYQATNNWTYLGRGFKQPGINEFIEWVKEHHPEMLEATNEQDS